MAIGNYVHAHYEHYKKFGITQNVPSRPNPDGIFSGHHDSLRRLVKNQKDNITTVTSKEEIERRLNYYFGARNKGSILTGGITERDLQLMEESIAEFLGDKLTGVTMDLDRLAVAKTSRLASEILNWKNQADQTIEQRIQKLNTGAFGKKGSANRAAVEQRIQLLLDIRAQLANRRAKRYVDMKQDIDKLELMWQEIQASAPEGRIVITKDNESFFANLNKFISSLLRGNKTVHGEYAEAVIAATDYLIHAKAGKEIQEVLKEDLVSGIAKAVQGADRSAKGLMSMHFDGDLVDLDIVTDGTLYHSKNSVDENGNYFSTNITQDKVDVTITVNDMKLPASVKNYDLGNEKFTDIHLLSGSSVLMLAQEYENFMNHYLNIVANHEDSEPGDSTLNKAHLAMKMTILLKALQGGLYSRGGKTGTADIFIVNDSSKGGFKVYFIDDIIEKVSQNMELLKTGDYDKVNKLNNNYIGDAPSDATARVRISKLLAQLHNMKLEVSVDKSAII